MAIVTGAESADGVHAPVPDVRFIGELPGCYILASRREAGDHVRVFACRVKSISTGGAILNGPVIGEIGERLTLRVEPLGLLRGHVTRRLPDGFAMNLEHTDEERARLAARLGWLKKRVNHTAPDRREDRRLLPRNTRSAVLLADNRTFLCFVIDVSCSGVAVAADIHPRIGTQIAVGTLTGHVVRDIDGGFAVQFAERQALETVEEALLIHPDARHAVLTALQQLVASDATR